ncbi:hypothetical protein P8452_00556 [Trifolium repens]|nr:hypothetical protein P8452_00556 [Trifolium repens]
MSNSCSSSNIIINPSKQILVFLSLVITLSSLPTKTNSLFFNITNFDDPTVAKNISFQGDGRITNGSIDLNKVSYYFRVGRAIYSQPLHLWDKNTKTLTSFTTRFTFTITSLNDTSYGDGFVFFLAPLGYQIPPNSAGGVFGLFNATTNSDNVMNYVVAVEFDTFVGSIDPPMKHVGIDDNALTSVAFGKFDIDNNLGKVCHVLIDYSSDKKMLEVFWSFKGDGNFGNSSISYQIDLMKKMPEYVNIGFSASTGLVAESNVIHSWEFSSNLNSDSTPDVLLEGNGEKGSSKTVVLIVAVIVPVILVFLIASVVGWVILKRKRKNVDEGLDEYGIPVSAKFDLDKATIPRRFEYSELVAATNGFADDRMLGRGGGFSPISRIQKEFSSMSTKLGDFGMAKLVDPMLRTQRTGVVGTYGYLAPEYINGGRASKESDMYSFGIVALEITTGRRIFQDGGDFHVPLMNWVWGLYVEGNLMSAADERLNLEFDVNEMKSLLIVGLWCTHSNDKERPKAYEVIKVLNHEMALPELPLDMHDHAPPIVSFRPSNYVSLQPQMTNSLVSDGR